MLFISHNYNDKLVVQPIAERLAEIFGRKNVFYDSWSIQPGDGIIDKMNEGLANVTHFFFFVSDNSMKSKMVKMEWQNAIFKASKGNCKVIPVRLDETSMPPILAQSLYIDLFSNGIETTIAQMVNVIQGNSTYNSSSQNFSNLTYTLIEENSKSFKIKVYASHFLEPIPEFLILINNDDNELSFSLPNEGSFYGGFNGNVQLNDGRLFNAQLMRGGLPITPKHPFIISVIARNDKSFLFTGLMHKAGEGIYQSVPERK
jgi:hypothetical protein